MLARYNTDGSLDSSFGGDGMVVTDVEPGWMGFAHSAMLQPDGKILITGMCWTDDMMSAPTGPTRWRSEVLARGNRSGDGANAKMEYWVVVLVRYNADGSLDTTFSGDGKVTADLGFYDDAYASVLDADGNIVVAITTDDSTGLTKYYPNGDVDSSFLTYFLDWYGASALLRQPDGRLVMTSGSGQWASNFAVARVNANGTLDSTFGEDGITVTEFGGTWELARSAALQADGGIVVVGLADYASSGYDFAVARYISDQAILPLELLYLVGEAREGYNLIKWGVASESNIDHYELESSGDLTSWGVVGEVLTLSGSVSQGEYALEDHQPWQPVTYYRLKQTYLDGRFDYSKIVAVERASAQPIVAFPNPTSGTIDIDFGELLTQVTVSIRDVTGRLLYKEDYFEVRHISLNILQPSGLYVVEVGAFGMEVSRTKVVRR
jgi:uncharacterized delta-60 repeat protein